ncbi:hypothetical protein [Leptolyngbya sp. PCC 6406]|uniref:hypothetical protein n=1 Tax=Leptolyngbya sp. PCC 6406 TaxID=1173264 RepID=UPI0002AC287D|nr:hypothetical protein [Leptolyngbya sp. PCC 6406]
MEQLTERQAFEAMVLFLEQVYERTESDDIGGLLSDLMIAANNQTADPAAWQDWLNCIHQVASTQLTSVNISTQNNESR